MARSMKLSAWPVYDEVLKIVAQAMLEWLTEIGGDADLQDPLELLQQCDNNRAVSTCLGFLFRRKSRSVTMMRGTLQQPLEQAI